MPKLICTCIQEEAEDVRELDYRHCSLKDVPNEVFNWERTLEELYVDANQIKILPRELFYCHGLRKLTVSDNEITSIPPAIASLINLEEIDISKNGILDLPENIKCCKHIRSVEASVNPLGKLPDGFTQLLNLTQLYLNDTFMDYLPGNFGRLSKLKILEVRENHLKTLPKSMCRLTELERLDIGNNDFTELPEVVGSLTGLLELWCDSNQITNIIPEIGNLKQLMYLDASKNRIEHLPVEIEGCVALSDLHLSTNLLRELPETLGRLSNLTTLKLDDNQLETLPFTVGGLASLSELNISANDLEELPASIGLLRCLRTLYADENLLIDLPPEVGSCTGLTVLSLRSNKLTYIPEEVGHIPRLRVLNLSDNKLQSLPFDLTKLKQLQALWLAENQSKPLIRLQTDLDSETGKRSLTCYLLPQLESNPEENFENDTQSFHPSMWEDERQQRQQIHFDFGDQSDHENKPIRSPTPYPKENKEKQRHARNLAMRQVTANNDDVEWNVKTQSVEKVEPNASNEGDRVRGRRSRSGSRDDLDEAGQKVSPLQETHKLYKADKEKLLKDKERIQRQKSVSPERKPEEPAEKVSPSKQKSKGRETSPPKSLKMESKENKPPLDKNKKKDKEKTIIKPVKPSEDDDGGFLQARGDRKAASVCRSDTDLSRAPSTTTPRHTNYWLNPPAKAPSVAASDFAVYNRDRHHRHSNHHRSYPRHHRHSDYESDTASVGYRSDYDYHGRRHQRDGYASDRDATRSERHYASYGSDFDSRSARSAAPAYQGNMGASPQLRPPSHSAPYNKRTTIRNDELYAQPMSSVAVPQDTNTPQKDQSDTEFKPDWKNQLYAVLEQRRQERHGGSQDGTSSLKGLPPYHAAPPYGTPPAYRARRRGVMSDSGVSPNRGRKLLAEFGPSTARPMDNQSDRLSFNGPIDEQREQSQDTHRPHPAPEPRLPQVPYQPPPQYKKPEPQLARPYPRHGEHLDVSRDSSEFTPAAERPYQHYMSMPSIPVSERAMDIPIGNENELNPDRQLIARTSSERTFQLFSQNPVSHTPPVDKQMEESCSKSFGASNGGQAYRPFDRRPDDARPYGSENGAGHNYSEQNTSHSLQSHQTPGNYQHRPDVNPGSAFTNDRNYMPQNHSPPKSYNPRAPQSRDYEHIDRFPPAANMAPPSRTNYEPPPHFNEPPPPVSMPYDMERFEDVAKYKTLEPNSQVSSSTDSGYGHGHHIYERVERLTGFPPGMMPPPNRAPPSPARDSPVMPPPGRDPPSLPTSRETTPSRNLDSGHGSMDQQEMMNSFPPINKSNLLPVVINKSPGLGFSIAGGVNSPGNPFRDNDLGIFVTKVQPGGPASRSLRPGDKIIEVNGADFTHIIHDQAVNVLKLSGPTVSMLIERSALTSTTI